ncbi:hypothetical protein NFI96_028297 [Prochilodus magdalenae]|nr:hypothetical protein NFI96_028297 [Prochilodus magdalenae]
MSAASLIHGTVPTGGVAVCELGQSQQQLPGSLVSAPPPAPACEQCALGWLKRFGIDPRILRTFYTCTVESILTGSITTWYGSCTAIERKALQRVVRAAQYITGVQLPNLLDLYTSRCLRKTRRVLKDSTHPSHCLSHPSHCLLSQLPSGRRFRKLAPMSAQADPPQGTVGGEERREKSENEHMVFLKNRHRNANNCPVMTIHALTFLFHTTVILCLSTCVGSLSADPQIFMTARVGSSAVLPCDWRNVSGSSPAHIKWCTISETVFERRGEEVYRGEGYEGRVDLPEDELLKGNCSLELKNIRPGDAGVYKSYLLVRRVRRSVHATWHLLQSVELSVDGKTISYTRY